MKDIHYIRIGLALSALASVLLAYFDVWIFGYVATTIALILLALLKD